MSIYSLKVLLKGRKQTKNQMKKEILQLRQDGYTYQQIADMYKTNKGLIWKIVNTDMEIEIGSKSRNRKLFPFWKLRPDFYSIIDRVLYALFSGKNSIKALDMQDYLLRFAYSRKESFLEQMKDKPRNYFYRIFYREGIRRLYKQSKRVYQECLSPDLQKTIDIHNYFSSL